MLLGFFQCPNVRKNYLAVVTNMADIGRFFLAVYENPARIGSMDHIVGLEELKEKLLLWMGTRISLN